MNHTAFFEQVKKGNIQPVYLMEGTEEYIKQQAVRNLCQKLLPAGLEELNLTDLTDPEVIFPHFVNYMHRFDSPRGKKKTPEQSA